MTQAAFVWAGSDADLEWMVETGQFGEASDVIPFNQALRDEIVKQYQGA